MNLPFHPVTASWFRHRFGEPTQVQLDTWAAAAAGEHVLALAPTGSGKTLAAFLVALDRLLSGDLEGGALRILYVSPLKALGRDVKHNLAAPLRELTKAFNDEGMEVPPIHIGLRTGDTSQSERRRQLTRPPEILVTTPESLNILLLSEGGRSILSGPRLIILDELHAVAPNKRGTLLACAVERLTSLAGEFQRVGLSATMKPVKQAAELLGGSRWNGETGNPMWEARRVRIVRSSDVKTVSLVLQDRPNPTSADDPDALLRTLAEQVKTRAGGNRSTLAFVDSRKKAEKLARFMNEGEPEPFAWAHHGSLSKELRRMVEQRLKEGSLKIVVATGSLELGIDIGDLDEVLLLSPPHSPSTALQRAGRAGHEPKAESRGLLYPLSGMEILTGAVLARMVGEKDIEEQKIPENPLDMLAQTLLALCTEKGRSEEDLFGLVRCAKPFWNLPRAAFDSTLAMLRGRYSGTRLAALRPRLYADEGLLRARPGTRLLLYTGGGAIPDSGMYSVRSEGEGLLLGTLDEEFVWETPPGSVMPLGNRHWLIVGIDDKQVTVRPTDLPATAEPFWRAESRDRDETYAGRIMDLLEETEDLLAKGGNLRACLTGDWKLEESRAAALEDYLRRQRRHTGKLPHHRHVPVEVIRDRSEKNTNVCIHSFWGGKVNRPLSLILQTAWSRRSPGPLRPTVTDNCIIFNLEEQDIEAFYALLHDPGDPEDLIRRSLESSAWFCGRFREAAGRALLLPSSTLRHRQPLWMNRMRAGALLEAVAPYPDFPILSETWRACLMDEFSMDGLKDLLDGIRSGSIETALIRPQAPSPFASSAVQRMTNALMTRTDEPRGRILSRLEDRELRRLTGRGALRPRIPTELTANLDRRRRRIETGWAPRGIEALKAWIAEREAFDNDDWKETLTASALESGMETDELETTLNGAVVRVTLGPLEAPWILAVDRASDWTAAFPSGKPLTDPRAAGTLMVFWISGRGPVPFEAASRLFGLDEAAGRSLQEVLSEEGRVILDRITEGEGPMELCDREGLEILLRRRRRRTQRGERPRPAWELAPFLARRQGLCEREGSKTGLLKTLKLLEGFVMPAPLWETALLPARLRPYRPMDLDELMMREQVLWVGAGRERIGFLSAKGGWRYPEPRWLEDWTIPPHEAFPGPAGGRRDFWDIAGELGLSSAEATARIWEEAWRGRLVCDDMNSLRRGIATGFASSGGTQGSGGFRGWRAGRPLEGRWYRPSYVEEPPDALEAEELDRERVRLLLARYGLLSRGILEREIPPWRWARLFGTLRLMELADEVIGGQWFEGLEGPQFLASDALPLWRDRKGPGSPWCLEAGDPASPCGLKGIPDLPPRREGTWLAWDSNGRTAVFLRPGGREIFFPLSPKESPPEVLDTLATTLTERHITPFPRLVVTKINRLPAENSPWAPVLEAAGFREEGNGRWIRRASPVGDTHHGPNS